MSGRKRIRQSRPDDTSRTPACQGSVAAENIFDRVYTTGRTTDGVISIGEPFMVRGGVRLRF